MFLYLFWAFLFVAAALCAWQISIADFRRRIIPDAYLLPLFLIGLITVTFFPHWICSIPSSVMGATLGYILSAGIGFVFDWIGHKKDPKSEIPIGMGDIKLLVTGGLWLGTNGLAIALVASCILGGIWGARKKQHFIPFAPFFMLGAILALIIMAFLV